MKSTNLSISILFSIVVLALSSCSVNQFASRKNHQPRVKIGVADPIPSVETASIEKNIKNSTDSIQVKFGAPKDTKVVHQIKPKETIAEKMVKIFMPKKMQLLEPLFHPKKLNKVKHTKMDGDQITGLVISLLALVLAITSMFMIIGMANGNVWVFFVVGLLLAIVALAMAFIAKKVLPFRGISLAAGVLAIIAIVLLVIFLICITVFLIVFH